VMTEGHQMADRSHRVMKAESAMKAQAWVSGISEHTSSSGYAGSTGPVVQSQLTTSLHSDAAQLTEPDSHAVMPSSLMQPSVTQAAALSLPVRLTPSNAVDERTVVKNPVHSSAVMIPHGTSDVITLGTPMKRVDSISASAGHSKTSSSVDRGPAASRRLPYGQLYMADGGSVHSDQYAEQFGSNVGLPPQVESVTEHRSSEVADLPKTSPTGVRNMQQQTVNVADERVNWHSSALDSNAVDRDQNSTKMVRSSQSPVLAASSQSSTTQHVDAASTTGDTQHVSSLTTSHPNARLNELWCRFSQDHTVCTPHLAGSATTLNISGVERTESILMGSNMQPSKYQLGRGAGEKSRNATTAENRWQLSSNSERLSGSLLGQSSLPLASTTNTVHHNSSFGSGSVSQLSTEPLRRSHGANTDTGSQPRSAEPSKLNDAGKESSYPGSVPAKHAWIITDETLPVVPEDTTLDSVTSDFTSASSIDDMGNIVTRTTKRHLPNDPKLLRLQQKIAQQREKHWKVRKNEQRRKEHIVKMELALREHQKAVEQKTADVKKAEGDHHPSAVQLEISTSSATLTTVTSNDSDVTLCSSVLQPDDRQSTYNSQLLSTSVVSRSCTCQQARREMQKVAAIKAREVSAQKRHKSDTAFKPKLHEVRYTTQSKATKSAPVLSRETSSHVREKNTSAKKVGRNVPTTGAARRSRIAESEALKNAQDHGRSPSKANRSAAKAVPSKHNTTNHVLTERNQHVSAELNMQSIGVQTTPCLRDNRVSYTNTAVQCPAVSSRFDDLGVISVPVASRGQQVGSLSSRFYSPDSSSDAEILQKHLKHSLLMKQPLRAPVPRESLKLIFTLYVAREPICMEVSVKNCGNGGFIMSKLWDRHNMYKLQL